MANVAISNPNGQIDEQDQFTSNMMQMMQQYPGFEQMKQMGAE